MTHIPIVGVEVFYSSFFSCVLCSCDVSSEEAESVVGFPHDTIDMRLLG